MKMEQQIYCNLKECRKKLGDYAWVTICSHVICDEDGYKKFKISKKCPVCETVFEDPFDFVRHKMNMNEQEKSLMFFGFRPETIIDICSRALSFWVYQIHLEYSHQEFLANKSKQYYKQLETTSEADRSKVQVEISLIENEIVAQKKTVNELKEKLADKHKECQRLRCNRNALRRRFVKPNHFETTPFNMSVPVEESYEFLDPISKKPGIDLQQKGNRKKPFSMFNNEDDNDEPFVLNFQPSTSNTRMKVDFNLPPKNYK